MRAVAVLMLAFALAGSPVAARSHGPQPSPSPSPAAAPSPAAGSTAIITTKLPFDADALDAAFDAAGGLHVTYARGKSFFYTQRPPNTKEFRAPIKLGTLAPGVDPETTPQIAVWPKGNPCALWKGGGAILLSMSSDKGKSFQAVSTAGLLVANTAIEVPTLIVGGDGALHLLWVDHRDALDPKDAVARHLYFSTTRDRGKTWAPARALTKGLKRACPCCQPAAAAGPGGEIFVAYRTSDANVKEIALLHSTDSGHTFQVKQVSDNHWYVKGCPTSGPSLAVSGGQVALIWMADQDLYSTTSADDGRSFSHPLKLGAGFFHQAAGSHDRSVMLFEQGDKVLAWRSGDAAPARVEAPPRGSLVAGPGGRFELIAFDRGEE